MNKVIFGICSLLGVFIFVQNVFAQSGVDEEFISMDGGEMAAGAFFMSLAVLLPLLIFGFISIFILFCTVFWIWMIVDAAQNEKENDLVVWILILIFVQFLGAIIYYFARKRPRDKAKKKQPMINQSNT